MSQRSLFAAAPEVAMAHLSGSVSAQREFLGLSEQSDVVFAAVQSGRLDPRGVAEKYWNVEFNVERMALQVLGCSEAVLAHIPVPETRDGEAN